MTEFTFFEKDGYISPSLSDLYDVAGEDDLDPIAWKVPAFQLVEGRHEMPLDMPAIFKSIDNVMDFEGMSAEAFHSLIDCKGRTVVIYVTGLTAAALAVANICNMLEVYPIFMHYNRDDGRYYPQFI